LLSCANALLAQANRPSGWARMIRIAITEAAYEAVAATLPLVSRAPTT
jgi:hypothetical protein